jgi:hypothetical protein
MMNQFQVYEPEENTILCEAAEEGVWAYDQYVFLKTIIQRISVCIQKINEPTLEGNRKSFQKFKKIGG